MDMGPGVHRVKPRGRHRAPEKRPVAGSMLVLGFVALSTVIGSGDVPLPNYTTPPAQGIEPTVPVPTVPSKSHGVDRKLKVSRIIIKNPTPAKIKVRASLPPTPTSQPTPVMSESQSVTPAATLSNPASTPAPTRKKRRKRIVPPLVPSWAETTHTANPCASSESDN